MHRSVVRDMLPPHTVHVIFAGLLKAAAAMCKYRFAAGDDEDDGGDEPPQKPLFVIWVGVVVIVE